LCTYENFEIIKGVVNQFNTKEHQSKKTSVTEKKYWKIYSKMRKIVVILHIFRPKKQENRACFYDFSINSIVFCQTFFAPKYYFQKTLILLISIFM